MKTILLCMLLWLSHWSVFTPPLYAQESPVCTIFRSSDHPDTTLPNIHPEMDMPKEKPKYWDYGSDWIMLSVQEEDLLKVAFYRSTLKQRGDRLDIHNPSRRDFTGMPARLLPNSEVLFADGTKLKSYLPPDAKIAGGGDWSRDIRWKRIYKNYYYLTLYKGTHAIHYDGLVTEKDGQDLSPLFGESSATSARKKFAGGIGPHGGIRSWRDICNLNFVESGRTEVVNIVRVDEQDLPPDFPKGLVRWIP